MDTFVTPSSVLIPNVSAVSPGSQGGRGNKLAPTLRWRELGWTLGSPNEASGLNLVMGTLMVPLEVGQAKIRLHMHSDKQLSRLGHYPSFSPQIHVCLLSNLEYKPSFLQEFFSVISSF